MSCGSRRCQVLADQRKQIKRASWFCPRPRLSLPFLQNSFYITGTRRFQREVVGKDVWVFSPLLRAGSGAYPEIFGGNGMSQADIDSLLKEDRLFTPATGFSSGAHIKSREDYDRIYKRSVEDPEGF